MFLSKLKIVAVLLLAVGVLATSRTFSQRPVEAAPPEEAKQESPPAKEKPQEKKEKPIFVEVVKPQKGGVDRKTTGACSVQAFQTAEITAQVSGLLKNFSVDIGDRVRMGQLLAEIDAPLTDLEEKQASSAVKQASGQLQVVRAGIEGARAKVNAAKAMVVQRQAELDRAQAIVTFRKRQLDAIKTDPGVPRGTVTEKEQQAEEARGDVLAARAALDRARADVLVREGEVAAAEAAVEAAQGGLEVARVSLARAQLMRERTRITAPIAGIVTGVEHRSGQVLAPEGRGPCLLHLMRTDSMRVVTQVTEQFVPSTRVGLPVKLAFDALPGVPFSDCKVSRIGYILDEKTRTMRVEIDVPNPQQKLRPGMSGWAEILLQKGSPKALRLSTSCVRFVGNREHVFVVRDGKARLTAVKVGFGDGEQIEVLSGLEPAERVILSPAATLREGDPVEIKKERSPE